jgi:hypothetical protein
LRDKNLEIERLTKELAEAKKETKIEIKSENK